MDTHFYRLPTMDFESLIYKRNACVLPHHWAFIFGKANHLGVTSMKIKAIVTLVYIVMMTSSNASISITSSYFHALVDL